ncbi:MAG TPA: hypothetical protein VJ698_11055 [Noviherbaspirillum sp.]|uniref:hypothetical protein n=1 Tax=Noviherbaspirillum sp. TaxID=1926288 RepID=UPI002B467092|nr:hypothetical protein [Noviherbaspirillum sp.]HJV86001.1 hypothetical protein [Noviherbaspirillum sp.]
MAAPSLMRAITRIGPGAARKTMHGIMFPQGTIPQGFCVPSRYSRNVAALQELHATCTKNAAFFTCLHAQRKFTHCFKQFRVPVRLAQALQSTSLPVGKAGRRTHKLPAPVFMLAIKSRRQLAELQTQYTCPHSACSPL